MSRITYRGFAERSIFAVALIAMTTILAATAARATTQTLTVTTTADSGAGSLREAISTANADTGDTINFNISGTGPFVITLTSGPLPTIVSSMTIEGGTTPATAITIDGGETYPLLLLENSNQSVTLNLNNLTFADGAGAIVSYATTANVTNCTFLGNGGSVVGGAINVEAGTLNVTNSTFSSNSATQGGAIFDMGAVLNVTNSTFSGNSAESSNGGGIALADGAVANLKGTILAASTGNNCQNLDATLNDKGYNISDDSSCGFSKTGSANNGDGVEPLLAALTNNGGSTETFALQSSSPAIGAITVADCTYLAGPNPCTTSGSDDQLTCDQRGEPRPGSGETNCDIGAFEVQLETAFAAFQAALAVDLPDNFVVLGSFTPAASAPAIDPTTQPVTLTFSWGSGSENESLTIPAGSFKEVHGQYEFNGKIGDVDVSALITSPFKNSYGYVIAATGLELSGITNPVGVTLQVGSSTGTDNVKGLIF